MSVCYDITKFFVKLFGMLGLLWLIVWFGTSDNVNDKWPMMFFVILFLFIVVRMDREYSRRVMVREFRRNVSRENSNRRNRRNRRNRQEGPGINIIRQHILSVDQTKVIGSEKCVICLDDYNHNHNVGELECEHKFHQECIEKWLMEKTICPLCKYNVLSSNDDESLDDNPRYIDDDDEFLNDNPEHVNNNISLEIIVR